LVPYRHNSTEQLYGGSETPKENYSTCPLVPKAERARHAFSHRKCIAALVAGDAVKAGLADLWAGGPAWIACCGGWAVVKAEVEAKQGKRSIGYLLKAGQLTYDCRYSTMHGMPVTGGRGFRSLKPLWYNGVPS